MINVVVKYLFLLAISVVLMAVSGQTSAAWFEAQGQALIQQGNRAAAKERATEEAIRHALMFAGASVQSVQMLTNGLLSEDSLKIRASGEVQNLELIDEYWHDGYVTVKIRADIFPNVAQCHAAAFQKTLVTTWFPLENRQQAQDGQIHQLSEAAPRFLQQQFRSQAEYASLIRIEPYTVKWSEANVLSQAPSLARLSRAQYILAAVITDVSLHRPPSSALAFWKSDDATRQFAMNVFLVDGMNGAMLIQEQYRTEALWEFDRFTPVDVTGDVFWRSQYGQAITQLFTRVVEDVDQILTCQPATGRVLAVEGDQLQVSLGRAHGIQPGDELTLYKTNQVIDPQGMQFLQYQLYPTKVKVVNASVDNATVVAVNGGILANIQPNDFVAKGR
ncbi:flagellar assembly protein T N-terminal domain-containing protein [Aestuariibacter sp. A3R04]|uniref:flagellar assembly protein T N-terminal domain-containing protein n=1 Tax=Aestuariibacter sp. A3R04 TaxID=2841571 RepID=UPI001C08EEDC|nr:flagellar assembly protein T N-terminal domain-containing protein [Aestuariibacter sp. A3R04]MBU3022144.1 flagella assembly protein FlgT [Aestuariibacter sp. A3R04]